MADELQLQHALPVPAGGVRTYGRGRGAPRVRLSAPLMADLQTVADETGSSPHLLARLAVYRFLHPVDLSARAEQWLQRQAAAQGHHDPHRALVELLDHVASRYPTGIIWPPVRDDLAAELAVPPWLR